MTTTPGFGESRTRPRPATLSVTLIALFKPSPPKVAEKMADVARVLQRVPDDEDARCKSLKCLGDAPLQPREFVGRLEGRIDQDQAAPLFRRQQGLQCDPGIEVQELGAGSIRQCRLQGGVIFGMQLVGDQLIARPHQGAGQHRTARIGAYRPGRIHAAHDIEIRRESGRRTCRERRAPPRGRCRSPIRQSCRLPRFRDRRGRAPRARR